ncbi:hypothetical protein [Pedobacter cryotolerans]|uniref:Uncharacterized protein n=1 Tax=Pedobacter cryotolerans TaxID=2571270 RepID=A0A4U1C9V8_9SPHI|nr:hypothetical protein [Pedobacter cryotolerans]TKC01229.1 hypothetical protein FA045_08265 [Pedobacter cryotolerans]
MEEQTTVREKPQWIMPLSRPYIIKSGLFGKHKEEIKEFVFNPTVIGVQYKYAQLALTLNNELIGLSDQEAALKVIKENNEKVIMMVALTIHNCKSDVPKSLLKYLETIDQIELLQALHYSMAALCLDYFTQSIILLRGTARILSPANIDEEIPKSHV